MIQVNLLPDVKIEFLKIKRAKRLAIIVSSFASVLALAVLLSLVGIVDGLQKKHMGDLDRDIKHGSSQLQSKPDLNKVLTVQNQLLSLPDLHNQKPVASRLFDYVAKLTPSQVTIAKLEIDFSAHTSTISGAADSLNMVNTFADTLKFATYHTGSDNAEKQAFSSVVLSSFTRDDKTATYTMAFQFDPAIFDSANDNVTLTVPSKITTRSESEKPSDLFQQGTPTTNTNKQ